MTVLEVKHQGKLKEWQERIMGCRSSGKTVKTWCGEQGISVATYYRWEREIFGKVGREKDGEVPTIVGAPVFAELPAVQTAHTGGARPMITVRTGGIAVDIYTDADKEMLQNIVQALRTC